MTMVDYCPRPKAEGNSPPWSSETPRGKCFDYLSNIHEITVLLPTITDILETMAIEFV